MDDFNTLLWIHYAMIPNPWIIMKGWECFGHVWRSGDLGESPTHFRFFALLFIPLPPFPFLLFLQSFHGSHLYHVMYSHLPLIVFYITWSFCVLTVLFRFPPSFLLPPSSPLTSIPSNSATVTSSMTYPLLFYVLVELPNSLIIICSTPSSHFAFYPPFWPTLLPLWFCYFKSLIPFILYLNSIYFHPPCILGSLLQALSSSSPHFAFLALLHFFFLLLPSCYHFQHCTHFISTP